MKKICTLIFLAASITTGFAQGQQPQQRGGAQQYPNYPPQNNNYNQYGSLIVTSALQRQFSVYVDNYQYQSNGANGTDNTVNIGQLNAGNHNIAVYISKTNIWGKQVQEVVYNSTLNFKPGFEKTIFINNSGQVNINERQVYTNNDDQGYGNNGNGAGYGYGRKKNKHKKDQCCKNDNDGNRNGRKMKDRKEQDDD